MAEVTGAGAGNRGEQGYNDRNGFPVVHCRAPFDHRNAFKLLLNQAPDERQGSLPNATHSLSA
jgi:hypothetical protein